MTFLTNMLVTDLLLKLKIISLNHDYGSDTFDSRVQRRAIQSLALNLAHLNATYDLICLVNENHQSLVMIITSLDLSNVSKFLSCHTWHKQFLNSLILDLVTQQIKIDYLVFSTPIMLCHKVIAFCNKLISPIH